VRAVESEGIRVSAGMLHPGPKDTTREVEAAPARAHLPVGGDAREKKLAGVKPAPPRKNFVRGGAGFMPAGIPFANRQMQPAGACGAPRATGRPRSTGGWRRG
jgi:hypothetical protein